MEKKAKIAALTIILIFSIAATVYLSLPTVYAEVTQTSDGQYRISLQYRRRAVLGLRFLSNGTPETLTGQVTVLGARIIVLETEGKQVNVILPPKWVVDNEIISTSDLFDGEPLSIGQTVSLQTLKLELIKERITLRAYVAYEIQTNGETIKALLPVNIESS